MPELITAVYRQDLPQLQSLLKSGYNPADRSQFDASNRTALEVAVDNSPKYSELLIDAVVKFNELNNPSKIKQKVLNFVNHQSNGGHTALQRAASGNKVKVMKVLLDAGADPNIRDEHGETSLISAAYSGSLKGVKMLLDYGANPNPNPPTHIDPMVLWKSPLQIALERGFPEIAALLETEIYKSDLLNDIKELNRELQNLNLNKNSSQVIKPYLNVLRNMTNHINSAYNYDMLQEIGEEYMDIYNQIPYIQALALNEAMGGNHFGFPRK